MVESVLPVPTQRAQQDTFVIARPTQLAHGVKQVRIAVESTCQRGKNKRKKHKEKAQLTEEKNPEIFGGNRA